MSNLNAKAIITLLLCILGLRGLFKSITLSIKGRWQHSSYISHLDTPVIPYSAKHPCLVTDLHQHLKVVCYERSHFHAVGAVFSLSSMAVHHSDNGKWVVRSLWQLNNAVYARSWRHQHISSSKWACIAKMSQIALQFSSSEQLKSTVSLCEDRIHITSNDSLFQALFGYKTHWPLRYVTLFFYILLFTWLQMRCKDTTGWWS